MTKLHRVLTAVDFSEPARAAFDYALALSRLHDAELTVVHAVPTDERFNWHGRERVALVGSLRQAARAADVRFKVSVQQGDPAGVILLHAKARRADLIVLGTSKRSWLDHIRFGSVAETVALEAKQPVLVVPPISRKGGESMMPFKNILVAVDFGEGSSEAAEIIPADATTSRKVHARVVTGDPTSKISRIAAEVDADLILLGVTARGALRRLIMGSTAARVIRTAGRPILAIPQRDGVEPAPEHDENRWAVAA